MKVSIVIPAFNEEQKIGTVIEKVKSLGTKDEIIVINDGSTDRTAKIAKSYKGINVYSYKKNMGKGFAMRYGTARASSDYVIFFEGDDQLYAEDILKIKEKLKNADIVVGVRDFTKVPRIRRMNSMLTIITLFLATGKVLRDPLSGFFGINKQKFLDLKLKENRFCIESEIRYNAVKNKLKFDYINEKIKYHTKKSLAMNKLNLKLTFEIVVFLMKKMLRFA